MSVNISEIVKEMLENGFQIDPKAFSLIKNLEEKGVNIKEIIRQIIEKKILEKVERSIIRQDIESVLLFPVKEELTAIKEEAEQIESEVEVLRDGDKDVQISQEVGDFQSLFKSRYDKLSKIVSSRPDHYRIEKISELTRIKKDGVRRVSGLVMEKKMTRKNITVTIDDDTGAIEALAVDRQVIEDVEKVLLDSFVMVDIEFSRRNLNIIKSVSLPDIPERITTVSKKKVYVALTSDLHVGSKHFLRDVFISFINWLKQREKDSEIVKRIKYLIIVGDSVDGVGVYPGQESDLDNPDVERQYSELASLLREVPSSIEVFITPGNHDPVRQALPQPRIPSKYAKELYNIGSVKMLGNPSTVRLHGVNILIYHGRSLDDVIATTPGYTFTRPAIAMKSLLKARHLAPVYGKRTSLAPGVEDSLVIEDVPDIFHSGHVHTLDSENYRGTLVINSGSWQSQTPYQAKMGITPTPGVVPIVDLSTMNVLTRDFKRLEK